MSKNITTTPTIAKAAGAPTTTRDVDGIFTTRNASEQVIHDLEAFKVEYEAKLRREFEAKFFALDESKKAELAEARALAEKANQRAADAEKLAASAVAVATKKKAASTFTNFAAYSARVARDFGFDLTNHDATLDLLTTPEFRAACEGELVTAPIPQGYPTFSYAFYANITPGKLVIVKTIGTVPGQSLPTMLTDTRGRICLGFSDGSSLVIATGPAHEAESKDAAKFIDMRVRAGRTDDYNLALSARAIAGIPAKAPKAADTQTA